MVYQNILNKIKEENKDKEETEIKPTFIDADKYRAYHPNIEELKKDTTKVVLNTNELIEKLEKDLLLYYIENKDNIVFMTSLKDYEEMSELSDVLTKSNYNIYVYGMVTSFLEGFNSAQKRFELQLEDEREVPRYVSLEFYKRSYFDTRNTLKKIIGDNRLKLIRLFKRGKIEDELPEKIYEGNNEAHIKKVLKILEETEKKDNNSNYIQKEEILHEKSKNNNLKKIEIEDFEK